MDFSNSKVWKIPLRKTETCCLRFSFQQLPILTDSLKEDEKLIYDVHAELFHVQIILHN